MRKTYLYGAMALGLLFTACKSDDLTIPDSNYVAEADQTFYVAMTISGDIDGTRSSIVNGSPNDDATDFDAGTSESDVNNAYFVFYDANGQVVGEIVSADLNNDPNTTLVTDGNTNTVDKYYKSVVPVSIRKGEMKPIQVICYINPISPATLQNPLNMIQTITREQVFTTVGDKKYFAMSNSVYYPTNSVNTDNGPQIAVWLENMLFDTQDAALKEIENVDNPKVAHIYVDRYASKLQFTTADADSYVAGTRIYNFVNPENPNRPYTNAKVTLDFDPLLWAVNGQSNSTYVIKSFRMESETGQIMGENYGFNALNSRLNIFNPEDYSKYLNDPTSVIPNPLNENNRWAWNNPGYHRSYWGMSPAYYQSEYPEVSADLQEMGGSVVTNQTYLSYDEIVDGEGTVSFNPKTTTAPQYFRETTVGLKALSSNNPAAAVASVLLIGKYDISINGTQVTLPKDKGFYTYLTGSVEVATGKTAERPFIYFDSDDNDPSKCCVDGGETMLTRFLAQTTVLYKKENDGSFTRLTLLNPDDAVTLRGNFKVSEISKEAKAEAAASGKLLKLQNNARSLQFKGVPSEKENIYIATGNGYCQIVADDATINENEDKVTLSKANATLMQQVGYAYYYINGHGYFNIPVKHLGWYRPGNEQRYVEVKNEDGSTTKVESSVINWNKVRVGDFGMVRNHSYTINVQSITGLASGIGGENVPIIPPATTEDYFVAYTVRILKWAVVPTQNVKL